ncbi:MAG: type II toxin-antitoxin system RelE/ParE family toxin [Micropepsaceae bacterium]
MEIRQSELFSSWLGDLDDERARAKVLVRIRRLSLGNFGDVKPVGEGVSELRIDNGPGYRLYFVRRGTAVIVLLCGGDKRTQAEDIRAAKVMAKRLKSENEDDDA